MRIKYLPKEFKNTETGAVYMYLVSDGLAEPVEFKGKFLKIRNLYYQGIDSEGYRGHFTTDRSDTIWLAMLYDAYLRAGGKLGDLHKNARKLYKRWKFRRKRF